MTTTSLSLKSWRVRVAGAALALAALAGAGTAQARGDVVWSVGVQSPGISVGVANAPPVYVVPSHRGYYGRPYYRDHPRHYDKHRGHGHRHHDRRELHRYGHR